VWSNLRAESLAPYLLLKVVTDLTDVPLLEVLNLSSFLLYY